jgi:hypothetical protein
VLAHRADREALFALAYLLDDLGLRDVLPELARRALATDDPAVRSAGEWIKEEFLQPGGAAGQ